MAPVGQDQPAVVLAFGEGDTVVEAEQVRGVASVGGQDHHVVHQAGQGGGQGVEGVGHQRLELPPADRRHGTRVGPLSDGPGGPAEAVVGRR